MFRLIITLVFSMIFLTGCSRPETESAQVSMTLPSAESLLSKASSQSVSASTVEGFHLIINVTGEGTSIYCSYDSKRQTTVGKCEFNYPNVVIKEVPTGKSRLFQVMYAIDENQGTTFNYGEATTDVQGSEVSVNLKIAELSGNGKMGHIHGRYAGGTIAAPAYKTGTMLVRYKPTTGSPAMTLVEQEVFGGWFRTFSFGTIPVSYEVNGEQAFEKAMTLENFETLATTSGDDILKYLESATFEWIYGWFGPGTDSANLFASANHSPCISNEYINCLVNGLTDRTEFNGPFRFRYNTKSYMSYVNGDDIEYQFLPGAEADIDGLKMIIIPNFTNPDTLKTYYIDDGLWDCEALAKKYPTGIRTASITAGSPTTSTFAMSPVLASTDLAIVCPYKGTKLFRSAVLIPEVYNSFGHGGYSGPYVHMNIGGNGSDVIPMNPSSCLPVTVGLYKGQGTNLSAPAQVTVNYSINASQGSFYSDGACTTVNNSPSDVISMYSQTGSGGLYFKAAAEGNFEISITTSSTMGMPGSSQKISVSSSNP